MSGFPYRARVQFKYDAVEASELSVNPAEVVDVEEKNDSGWCLAKTADGRSGWLPADYLEKIEDTAALAAANLSDAMATLQQVQQQMAAKNAAAPNAADSAPAKAVEEAAAAIKQLQAAGGAAPAAAGDKKTCAGCKKELAKAFVIAKEKHFHPECFVCTTCKSPLGGKPFIEKDGSFYCEKDYYTAFNPKCAHCDQVIQGQYISALDKSWHPDHFVCAECGEPFKDSQFHKHNDLPYCEKHYAAKFAQNCSKCGLAITGQVFEALDQKFHLDCFQCEVGPHKIGESASFHVYENKVYCPTHFEELFLQKCAECGKMIQGQYVKVLDSHFHVECWKCTTCKTHITSGNCSQKDGRFYCKNCFGSAPSGSSSGAAAAGGAAAAAGGAAPAASKGPSGAAPKAPSGAAPAAPKYAAPRAGDGATTIAGTNIKVPQSIMAKVNAQAGVTEGPSVLDRKPNPQSSFVKPPSKTDDEPSVKTAEPAAKPGTIQWFVENDAKARGGSAAPEHVPSHQLEGPDKMGFVSYVALKNGNFPKTLDTSRKEAYLSDEDFAKCFKLSRVAFDKLPAWKKKQLKMNLGIW